MARLPQVGGDTGNWGQVLNDFLSAAHKSDGSLKSFVSVTDFEAKGDGITDDGPSFQKAIDYVANTNGGGTVWVPSTKAGYLFKSGIMSRSNVFIMGGNSLLINDAFTKGVGNHLFHLRDVENVRISGFRCRAVATGDFSGGRNPQQFAAIRGDSKRVKLDHLILSDHQNFTITYDNSSDTSKIFEDLILSDIDIFGDCGPVGDGSGIDLFPKGIKPARGLTMERLRIDVTRGQTNRSQHGPQPIKINNVVGASISSLFLKGGSSTGLTLTGGCRDFSIRGLEVRRANIGLNIHTSHHSIAKQNGFEYQRTENIKVSGYTYKPDGLTGSGLLTFGIRIGNCAGVRITDFSSIGNVQIYRDEASYNAETIEISSGEIVGGLFIENPASPAPDITDLRLINLTFKGGSSTQQGGILLNAPNYKTSLSHISNIVLIRHTGLGININGNDNYLSDIRSINAISPTTISSLIQNIGQRNILSGIRVLTR